MRATSANVPVDSLWRCGGSYGPSATGSAFSNPSSGSRAALRLAMLPLWPLDERTERSGKTERWSLPSNLFRDVVGRSRNWP